MALTASVRTDWAPTGASVTRVTRSPWTVKPVRVSVAFFVLLHIKPGGMKIFEKVFSGQLIYLLYFFYLYLIKLSIVLSM